MSNFMNFILELFMIKQSDKTVGLSQIKKNADKKPRAKEVSIRSKDVKLSDLMRHASWDNNFYYKKRDWHFYDSLLLIIFRKS